MYTYSIIITRNGQKIKKFLDFLPVLSIYFSLECQLLLEVKIQICIEKLRGLDFTASVESRHDNHVYYKASTPFVDSVLYNYFAEKQIGNKDAIIDVGCGKGRMLPVFSKHSFGTVAGLEYEKDLFEICKKNMSILGLHSIELFCDDATTFIGFDRFNYFYLFNPFHGEIMERFISQIVLSKKKVDRDITVLYFNPMDYNMFIEQGFTLCGDIGHNIYELKL